MRKLLVIMQILSGFILGYFLQANILVILTFIFIVIGVVMLVEARDEDRMIAMIYCGGLAIMSAVMWIIWYLVNRKTFAQDFFIHYVHHLFG